MAQYYIHTQSNESDHWVISHNLNSIAIVCDVFISINGGMEKILPYDVQITDANTLTVIFTSNRTGSVRIVG